MLLQVVEYGINRDLILILRFFALVIIFFMAFQVGKKIKDTSVFSSTTGFAIFLVTQGLFHFFIALPYLSHEVLANFSYYATVNSIFIWGMFSFIFFTELDNYLHSSKTGNERNPFLLSIIVAVGGFFLGILVLLMILSVIIIYIFIVIPTIITTKFFLDKYKNFEIIRRSKVIRLFFLGLTLAGFSNFLILDFFFSFFGYWLILSINTLLFITGGLLMTWAWNKLPSLSELDWMVKMERLLVIHLKSSRLMYHYDFKSSDFQMEGDLVSSAIGGLNVILKEILSSNGYIKEIYHGDKNIIFSHGSATACILITFGYSSEFKYRLRMFHLSFEKLFGGENLENWTGQLKIFEKADGLISQYFS